MRGDECPYDADGSCPLNWKTCSIAVEKSDETYAENCPKDEIGPHKAEIESLQAEIRKKDQEIKQSEEYIDRLTNTLRAVRQDGHHVEISDLLGQMATKDARIKDLEQQLAKQQAYMVHGEGTDEERLEKAKDELEKIKQWPH